MSTHAIGPATSICRAVWVVQRAILTRNVLPLQLRTPSWVGRELDRATLHGASVVFHLGAVFTACR
jgi:hypothetical protein